MRHLSPGQPGAFFTRQFPILDGNCPYLLKESTNMLCHSGIWVEKQQMNVPCGQCMPCRINKGRLWSARILLEWYFHPHPTTCWFVTLTYNEATVPTEVDLDGAPVVTLRKKEVLKWVNNVQRETGPFRYYIVGEYGDDTGRPHYHLAVFPVDDQCVPRLESVWKESFGFTSAYPLDVKKARYLANYTTKKLTKAADPRLKGNQEPEFRSSSRRPPLGARSVGFLLRPYLVGSGAALVEDRGDVERTVRIDGRIYPLDQYLLTQMRKQLGIPLLHRDRILANPNYLEFHNSQEAEVDDEQAERLDNRINAEISRRRAYGYARV